MSTTPPPAPQQPPKITRETLALNERTAAKERFLGLVDGGVFGKIGQHIEMGARGLAGWLLEGLFTLGGWIIENAVQTIIEVEKTQDTSMRRIASLAIQDLFNLDSPPPVGGPRGRGRERAADNAAIGRAVRGAILAELPASGPVTPEQGIRNAEKLLDTVTSLAIEGWYEGMIVETAGLGFINAFAELDDTLANVLGLGRLVRQGIGPWIHATIAEPVERAINRQIRPRLFSPAEAARALARGVISEEEYFEGMAQQGWTDAKARHLLSVNVRSPSIADIADFVRLGELEFSDGVKLLTDDGWQQEIAEAVLRLEIDKKLLPLKDRLASLAITMYGQREITETELLRLLLQADYTNAEIAVARSIGDALRARPQRLTQSQLQAAFDAGITDLSTVRDWIEEEGYTLRDGLLIEQLMLRKKLSADEKAARALELAEKQRAPNRN
jgi:hypothetical protein